MPGARTESNEESHFGESDGNEDGEGSASNDFASGGE